MDEDEEKSEENVEGCDFRITCQKFPGFCPQCEQFREKTREKLGGVLGVDKLSWSKILLGLPVPDYLGVYAKDPRHLVYGISAGVRGVIAGIVLSSLSGNEGFVSAMVASNVLIPIVLRIMGTVERNS